MQAIEWWYDLVISLKTIWGWLRIPRSGPIPEIYWAVRFYAHSIAHTLTKLPAERARKHLLALAAFVAQEGWPSIALEVAYKYRTIIPPEYEAYYRWRCGDSVSAYHMIADSISSSSDIPNWVPLLITSIFLQFDDSYCSESNIQAFLPTSFVHFITRAKQNLKGLMEQQNAVDILIAAKRCHRQIQHWASNVVMRYGYVGLVSPDNLSQADAALWYLLNGEFRRAKRAAQQALLEDKSLAIPRLVLASLWIPHSQKKARLVTERLLFPELSHGFVSWEQDVARKMAKMIREKDTAPPSWEKDANSAVQRCTEAHDVGLLHLIAHLAWHAGMPSLSETILHLFNSWGVVEYPMLLKWRAQGKPIDTG